MSKSELEYTGTRPSMQVRLITSHSAGRPCDERTPRRHAIAERNSEKLSLHISQKWVRLNGSSPLSAIIETRRWYTTVAIGPIPPEVENTSGEKDPRSTSLTLSSYALFSCSFFL